ncbi:hypothetical protein Vadar_031254 [Vaccinium darrowii]|uniref:Uncharacterized protein n=1 Tax=Vaccinium darrowii TaxID=229202 RepID=A0ACB7Y4D0_9ERIC|nr:hypothetical protein Vadar_031254 [Vaccinium darrowii]
MELFRKAVTVKLSHDNMYLVAKDDQESVCLEREGASKNAIWVVELVNGKKEKNYVCFRSCYDKYLTASNMLLRPSSRERKVLQTLPKQAEPSATNWEPIKDDFFSWQFQTPSGSFLRRNWGLPPIWNPVTHDIPRPMRMHKIVWEIEVLESLSFSYPLPLPFSYPLPTNRIDPSSSSSNVNAPTNGSLPTVAPPKFGKVLEHEVAWPLPPPPPKI